MCAFLASDAWLKPSALRFLATCSAMEISDSTATQYTVQISNYKAIDLYVSHTAAGKRIEGPSGVFPCVASRAATLHGSLPATG